MHPLLPQWSEEAHRDAEKSKTNAMAKGQGSIWEGKQGCSRNSWPPFSPPPNPSSLSPLPSSSYQLATHLFLCLVPCPRLGLPTNLQRTISIPGWLDDLPPAQQDMRGKEKTSNKYHMNYKYSYIREPKTTQRLHCNSLTHKYDINIHHKCCNWL